MLLVHQIGSVKIGEVVRYTVTYTPSHDRILPSPEFLYLRIRNTSSSALRAAFVHGPYTLSVAAYPAAFNPNEKFQNPRKYGVPEFEPMLKAGGTWSCRLVVPEDIRQDAGAGARRGNFAASPSEEGQSARWVIDVVSQVIFSTSAAVNYEILIARDEKSLNLGSSMPVLGGQAQVPQPGRVSDYQKGRDGRHPEQPKGVFSRAVRLKIEDTAALWNTPQLPGWDELGSLKVKASGAEVPVVSESETKTPAGPPKDPKKVHLVVLTHGLHGNLGGDMLFLKESIDAGVRQAKIDRKARKARERAAARKEKPARSGSEGQAEDEAADGTNADARTGDGGSPEDKDEDEDEDEDEEEVIVRGFSGNTTRTERGIKYLGKRLARYILSMTYPDQPYLPSVKAASETVSNVLHGGSSSKQEHEGKPSHKHSTIHKSTSGGHRAFKITKISFIAHSLGGLVQTYAIAYIQKHSPQFFDLIEPINFIALASPFLGLNHENPLYVKFALDFGLVGRTGQDLGLTWRAPTIARSGWGAIVSNLGENAHKKVLGDPQPESKPLLRILPTGPAHTALKKFRNRTVYSNVVNDGIVPLRTSCLLFLDWQGLGRVEKARRETGLVETVVGFGWAELTGANVTTPRVAPWQPDTEEEEASGTGTTTPAGHHHDAHEVPQPPTDATLEDDRQSLRAVTTPFQEKEGDPNSLSTATTSNVNPFTGFFNFFKSVEPPRSPPPPSEKQNKIYRRSQTIKFDESPVATSASSSKSRVTSGHEINEETDAVSAPPRTSFFESATDLINPKLPSIEYLIDPSKRPRTIFHDRVYHPSDIPPPPLKKRPAGSIAIRRKSYHRSASSTMLQKTSAGADGAQSAASSPFPSPGILHEDSMASAKDYDDTVHTNPDKEPDEVIDSSNMKVEEKIARAYHRGLSWRKVLVKLEPDAHNNLVVRRMFANAFGWPVIKHLVDAHFSDSAAARMRDDEEENTERARAPEEAPDEHGAETTAQTEGTEREPKQHAPTAAELSDDDAGAASSSSPPPLSSSRPGLVEERTDSEKQEATDTVSDLPAPPRPTTSGFEEHKGSSGIPGEPATPSRRPGNYDRKDSTTSCSDRDYWDDESDDSDADSDLAYGRRPSTGDADEQKRAAGTSATRKEEAGVGTQGEKRSSSPLADVWNWKARIAGKAGSRSPTKSPQPQEDDVD